MKYTIPIDPAVSKTQVVAIFKAANRKNVKNILLGLLAATLLILSAILQPKFATICYTLAAVLILFYLSAYFSIKKHKAKFLTATKQLEQNVLKYGTDVTYEFTDNYVHISNSLQDVKMGWELCKAFEIIERNLILIASTGSIVLIIGEQEVGGEEFEKITALVRSKVLKDKIWGK